MTNLVFWAAVILSGLWLISLLWLFTETFSRSELSSRDRTDLRKDFARLPVDDPRVQGKKTAQEYGLPWLEADGTVSWDEKSHLTPGELCAVIRSNGSPVVYPPVTWKGSLVSCPCGNVGYGFRRDRDLLICPECHGVALYE